MHPSYLRVSSYQHHGPKLLHCPPSQLTNVCAITVAVPPHLQRVCISHCLFHCCPDAHSMAISENSTPNGATASPPFSTTWCVHCHCRYPRRTWHTAPLDLLEEGQGSSQVDHFFLSWSYISDMMASQCGYCPPPSRLELCLLSLTKPTIAMVLICSMTKKHK